MPNEFFRSEVGAIEIASRQTIAAGVKFARHADGRRLQVVVEDINLRIRNRPANGNGAAFSTGSRDAMAAGKCRILRRPVTIDEFAPIQFFQCFLHVPHRQHITSRQKLAYAAKTIELLFDHLMEQARREPERGDVMLLNELTQLCQRWRVRRKHDQLRAI